MSRSGRIRRFFGEDEHDFRLRIGEAVELQELSDAGLLVTLERVTRLAMTDVRAVLRLGLIGGGMAKEEAAKLVKRHVRDGYFAEAAQVASAVIEAAIRGAPDEPLGEAAGASGGAPSPTERSGSETSMVSPSPPAA